jgi:hypothetical protein
LWGYPELSADEGKQVFDEPVYEEGLTRNVPDMRIGDVLFVHRIHVSKIIYVSEVIEPPRKSTVQEIEKDAWRKRWTWAIRARNLSPEYGRYWNRCGERTFNLAGEFNELHSDGAVNIRRLNYGSHVKIPRAFAEFLLITLRDLKADKCMQENSFRLWLLTSRGIGTVASRLSNCRVVEKWEGSLDEHYSHDNLESLLDRLTYTKDDERLNRPARHNIPIDGNIYNGTATYKAAVSLYKQFRDATEEYELTTGKTAKFGSRAQANRQTPDISAPKVHKPETNLTAAVTVSQLTEWRRKLIKCLVELEAHETRSEIQGVAERISRLQRSGVIPRETAALMRTITEMRNAAEYQDKTLSAAESRVVCAAWEALQEWAAERSLNCLSR